MPIAIDPILLTQELIRCQRVTPTEGGAISLLADLLTQAGFECTRIDRGGIANLFARFGQGKTLGFNGHTDVVPPGDSTLWRHPPFDAVLDDGVLYGRGAVDMKSAVAAFVAAAVDYVQTCPPNHSLVITITGDEEGVATDGTIAILDWMAQNNERIDHCLVGEPTCPNTMGDMIKIGRRGSMTAYITANGTQGHSAYPHRAHNPIHALMRLLDQMSRQTLDEGTEHFAPSTLVVTGFDVGNKANNVIPATARGMVNIRFNDAHSAESLKAWINDTVKAVSTEFNVDFDIDYKVSGESFVTQPDGFTQIVQDAVQAETGVIPVLSTSGGTSDARFIKDHCPVVEVGLVGKTMHQVDECVPLEQISQLCAIYRRIITNYFA